MPKSKSAKFATSYEALTAMTEHVNADWLRKHEQPVEIRGLFDEVLSTLRPLSEQDQTDVVFALGQLLVCAAVLPGHDATCQECAQNAAGKIYVAVRQQMANHIDEDVRPSLQELFDRIFNQKKD